jgi:hypothetical protein
MKETKWTGCMRCFGAWSALKIVGNALCTSFVFPVLRLMDQHLLLSRPGVWQCCESPRPLAGLLTSDCSLNRDV